MNHGSLESGIGMFDYAAEQAGWNNVFHCEINPFCQTVLKYYWPKAESYADIFEFSGTEWTGKVDIITCGFPCQPFSNAGKREGSNDDRHLWPENIRIIREAQPSFVLAENVPGLLTIENGMVFEQVCVDLEAEGYEVTPLIIPAVATDKDHRRDRVWIVGYSKSNHEWNARLCNQQAGQQVGGSDSNSIITYTGDKRCNNGGNNRQKRYIQTNQRITSENKSERERWKCGISQIDANAANSINEGLQRNQQRGTFEQGSRTSRPITQRINNENWLEAATRLCSLDDELPGGLDTETISKSKWRTESLKAYGNTIVWEIAYNIYKAIEETLYFFPSPVKEKL